MTEEEERKKLFENYDRILIKSTIDRLRPYLVHGSFCDRCVVGDCSCGLDEILGKESDKGEI
jgi:hypothetical protein